MPTRTQNINPSVVFKQPEGFDDCDASDPTSVAHSIDNGSPKKEAEILPANTEATESVPKETQDFGEGN